VTGGVCSCMLDTTFNGSTRVTRTTYQ
jgi:hypothetical protein